MKMFRSKSMTALALSLLVTARSAAADSSATDKSTATELFKEGRALFDQGRTAEACRKLEESQRLDPGGGTLLNLALCHEREGRTATAWVEFTEALGIAKKDERAPRAEFARAHIAQLEPSLSRLVVEVPVTADLPDLEIKRDGSVLARAAWGSPIPIDPGDHVIEAKAPGKTGWKQSVVVGPKPETKTLTVPQLEESPDQEDAVTTPPPMPSESVMPRRVVADASGRRPPHERAAASSGGSVTPFAWISVGLGAAAAGAGTYFALHAIALKHDADRNCTGDLCTAQGASQNSDAIKSANFATAAFAVGAVGLGAGIALFVAHAALRSRDPAASPDRDRTSVTVSAGDVSAGPCGGEVTIAGHF